MTIYALKAYVYYEQAWIQNKTKEVKIIEKIIEENEIIKQIYYIVQIEILKMVDQYPTSEMIKLLFEFA